MDHNAQRYQEKALDYFHQGFSCSQSVFVPFAGFVGLSEDQALRLSAPFGAGMGRMRGVCGAFYGVTLLNGMLFGNTRPGADEKEKIYARVRSMADEFRQRMGALECRDLMKISKMRRESARPEDRTEAYYQERPCVQCIQVCSEMGHELCRQFEELQK